MMIKASLLEPKLIDPRSTLTSIDKYRP